MSEYAYITVMNNNRYLPGVLALDRALKAVDAKYPFFVVIPKDEGAVNKELLKSYDIFTIELDDIIVKSGSEDHYWQRTFFKLRVLGLTQFEKIVLLDSDMLITTNIDELFEKDHYSAAIAGKAMRDRYTMFNSGIMVLTPSKKVEKELIDIIDSTIVFCESSNMPCGDQDVFQRYMPDWASHKELCLEENYNTFWNDTAILCKNRFYSSMKDIKIVHFIGPKKPWDYSVKGIVKILLICIFRDRSLIKIRFFMKYLRYCKS